MTTFTYEITKTLGHNGAVYMARMTCVVTGESFFITPYGVDDGDQLTTTYGFGATEADAKADAMAAYSNSVNEIPF